MTEDTKLQDRYALIEKIGSGGMAEVWLARDSRLKRDVAIKFLDEKLLGNPESHVRFFTEAQAAARISHPNVVKVLDFGQSEDVPYLVMEYVAGGTLGDLLGDEPLGVSEAVEIIGQAAEGAGALHREDLVHRDLKPANILIDRSGTVKVTDLGIAAGRAAEHMTDTGAAIGSPHYISPEQVAGKEATPASDVYSLGVVLYEALTGTKPFDGDNVTGIAIAHVEREPEPPSTHRPDIPPEVDALVLRCMAKDPQKRFADGTDLAGALSAPAPAAAGTGSGPRQELAGVPAGSSGRFTPRVPAGALLIALLLLASAAVVATRMGGEEPAAAGTSPSPTKQEKEASPSPSPSEATGDEVPVAEPSPSKEPKEDRKEREKDSGKGSKDEPEPDPSPEPSPEPEPEPSAEPEPEPSAEPSPQETSQPEDRASPAP